MYDDFEDWMIALRTKEREASDLILKQFGKQPLGCIAIS